MKIKNGKPFAISLLLGLSLSGCTYVSLSEAGSRVNQSSLDAVSACKLVGDVSSQTKDKVLLDRNTGKVKQELIVLARASRTARRRCCSRETAGTARSSKTANRRHLRADGSTAPTRLRRKP